MTSLLISDEEARKVGKDILEAAKSRWLSESEVFLILKMPNKLGIPLSAALPHRPTDGSIFLFRTTKDLKDDGYDWKKKYRKDLEEGTEEKPEKLKSLLGEEQVPVKEEESLEKKVDISLSLRGAQPTTTLQESHFKLKINEIPTIQSIHIKLQDDETFKRRIYKLLNVSPSSGYYQLSHYRREDEAKPTRFHGANAIVPNVYIGYLVYTWLIAPHVFPLDYHGEEPSDPPYSFTDSEHTIKEKEEFTIPMKRSFSPMLRENLVSDMEVKYEKEISTIPTVKKSKVNASKQIKNPLSSLPFPSNPSIDTSGLDALLTAIQQTSNLSDF